MRWLPIIPVMVLLVLFALSNRQPVTLGFWPTDYTIQPPLALAMLLAMAVGFLAGAVVVWAESLSQRLRARRAETRVKLLESQNDALRAERAVLTAQKTPLPSIDG